MCKWMFVPVAACIALVAAACVEPPPSESGATQISAGGTHSCAVVAGGAVKCWGSNSDGQLGDGNTNTSSSAVDVVGVSGATQIAAGFEHTCAVVAGGAVKCWGNNAYGALGDGTTTHASTPVDVVGVSGATQIAAGYFYTCAVVGGGAVTCWGNNDFGQLGDGTTTYSSTPVDVVGVSGASLIAVGGGGHTCAVVGGGAVTCWGNNDFGQLGDGTTTYSSTPVDVVGVSGGSRITAGGRGHACAVVGGGAVKCWGFNFYGQLGDGTTTDSSTAVDVIGIS